MDPSAIRKDIKEHKEWECHYKRNTLSLELGEEISAESLKPKDENAKKTCTKNSLALGIWLAWKQKEY